MTIQCSETVYPKERWGCFHGYQCTRKAWKDGFCKTHHPESVKARQEKSDAHFKEKWHNSSHAQLHRTMDTLKATREALKDAIEWIEATHEETDRPWDDVKGEWKIPKWKATLEKPI